MSSAWPGRAFAALRRARPTTILLVAWVILIVYGFPGQLTQDSYDHLREARARIYSDAHPPIINWVWAFLDYFVPGPFGMLVLQTSTFLLGLYAILRWLASPRAAAWLAAGIFLFPPIGPVMTVIWKDCMMAGLLAVGIAGVVSPLRSRKLLGLVAICLATAMRYNAFGATAPIVILLFQWRPSSSGLRRYAVATVTWLVVTLAAFGINDRLTDRPMHYWISSLAVYDIVGTYVNLGREVPDEELAAALAGTDLLVKKDILAAFREVYSTRAFFPILNHPTKTLWNLPINYYDPAPPAQREAIARAFWATITKYPAAYAWHRLRVSAAVIDLEGKHQTGAIIKRAPRDLAFMQEQGLATSTSKAQMKMSKKLQWLQRHTGLFTPWVYVLLSLLLLPLVFRQRDALALVLSGLGTEASLLFLAHSVDFRYSHWMITTTVLGIAFVIGRRAHAAKGHALPAATA